MLLCHRRQSPVIHTAIVRVTRKMGICHRRHQQRTLTMAKEPHNMQGGCTTRCNLCYIRIKADYLKNLRHARFMIACCLYAARFILEVEHSVRLCIVFTCSMMFACRGTIFDWCDASRPKDIAVWSVQCLRIDRCSAWHRTRCSLHVHPWTSDKTPHCILFGTSVNIAHGPSKLLHK